MDTAEALAEIRAANTPELALYWLRLATADRSYCHDITTPAAARLALARALALDEPAGLVAILATGAERLHALLARVEIVPERAYPAHRVWPDRITAHELWTTIGKPVGMFKQTITDRMRAHPEYEYRTIGKRVFHTIPYSALDEIQNPTRKPRSKWTKQTLAAIRKARAKKVRCDRERRRRKIRRLAKLDRLRRDKILEAIRNPRPLESFSEATESFANHAIPGLNDDPALRVNVAQVAKILGVARSTARKYMQIHPHKKRIGNHLTIPRSEVKALNIKPGMRKPKRDERKAGRVPEDRVTLKEVCELTGHAHASLAKRIVLHPEYLKIGRFHTVPRKAVRQFLVLNKKKRKRPKAS